MVTSAYSNLDTEALRLVALAWRLAFLPAQRLSQYCLSVFASSMALIALEQLSSFASIHPT
jgi:hypothetical protein